MTAAISKPLAIMASQLTTGVRRVAIIGGGPTGIASAKYLLAEDIFQAIDIFEQRDNVGGIWNLSGSGNTRLIPIPQTNPRYGIASGSSVNDALEFESPLYDYLETNIPKTMMAYPHTPFSDSLPLYPKHDDVLRYLEAYAEPIRHLVRFRTQVVDVRGLDHSADISCLAQKWRLRIKDLNTEISTEADYDAVIVANGHYTVPHVPNITGIAEWHKKYPNIIMHSKAYRRPEDFSGQKVIVVGNSASGLDIAGQLGPCVQQPVYLSSRSSSQLAPAGSGPAWRKDVAEIEEFVFSEGDRAVRTKNGDVFGGFDAVIFATGYFYSFPFLSRKSASPASSSETHSPSGSAASFISASSTEQQSHQSSSTPASVLLQNLTTSGLRTHDVYKHFLHINYPTLAFPLLNLKVVPFPLAENQAAVIARLWSGRLDLPSRESMRRWERDEEERLLEAHRLRPAPDAVIGGSIASNKHNPEVAKPKYEGGFHTLVYPEDAAQINTLYGWAASARPRDGLENDGVGKLGTRWDEEQVWLRKQFPNLKSAYTQLDDRRSNVTSVEELGDEWKFGFEKWKEETSKEEKVDIFRRAAVPGY